MRAVLLPQNRLVGGTGTGSPSKHETSGFLPWLATVDMCCNGTHILPTAEVPADAATCSQPARPLAHPLHQPRCTNPAGDKCPAPLPESSGTPRGPPTPTLPPAQARAQARAPAVSRTMSSVGSVALQRRYSVPRLMPCVLVEYDSCQGRNRYKAVDKGQREG